MINARETAFSSAYQGDTLRLRFRRTKAPSLLHSTTEWSDDLRGWRTDGVRERITQDLGEPCLMEAPRPASNTGTQFGRVSIGRR